MAPRKYYRIEIKNGVCEEFECTRAEAKYHKIDWDLLESGQCPSCGDDEEPLVASTKEVDNVRCTVCDFEWEDALEYAELMGLPYETDYIVSKTDIREVHNYPGRGSIGQGSTPLQYIVEALLRINAGMIKELIGNIGGNAS